jgi:hypothetical protein
MDFNAYIFKAYFLSKCVFLLRLFLSRSMSQWVRGPISLQEALLVSPPSWIIPQLFADKYRPFNNIFRRTGIQSPAGRGVHNRHSLFEEESKIMSLIPRLCVCVCVPISTVEQTDQFAPTLIMNMEPGQRSRKSDWLRAGRPRGRSSSPDRGKIFFVGPTQPPIQ